MRALSNCFSPFGAHESLRCDFGCPKPRISAIAIAYFVASKCSRLDSWRTSKNGGLDTGCYLKDFLAWHTKPRIYCGLEPDSGMKLDYFKEEEIDADDHRTA